MVLTNAERQARYRERLKAAAAAAQMSEEKAELLRGFRRRIVESRRQIELLRSGSMTVSEKGTSGWRDLRDETISREEEKVAEYIRLLQIYDPEALTAFADDEEADAPAP